MVDRSVGPTPFHRAVRGDRVDRPPRIVSGDHTPWSPRLLGVSPPADWEELVQVHDNRDVFQASPDDLPTIDIHSL